ncbi:MAG: ATP-binding protein [Prochloraceae cyanobacterium]
MSLLRLLTEAARSISCSDLNQRIPVQGKDEVAELTLTFNQMLARLQAAFNSQQDFLNDAGHELRTPLTIVRCYLEQPNSDPQEQQEALAIVKDELKRMTRLIEDLLLLAKAERPDFLNLEILDVSNFTDRLYAKVQSLGDRNWQLETKGSGHLLADPQRLTEALLNLAQNAVQHTTEGQVIAFGSRLREGQASFWVRDTGKGIPQSEQQKIFERFYRGASGSRSHGFGLGLAIVKKIAEAHGGRVEVISQSDRGSTFTLVIPLERDFEKQIRENCSLPNTL